MVGSIQEPDILARISVMGWDAFWEVSLMSVRGVERVLKNKAMGPDYMMKINFRADTSHCNHSQLQNVE